MYLAVCPALVGLPGALIHAPGLTLPSALLSGPVARTAVCGWRLLVLSHERSLGQWLTDTIGQTIQFTPILTLPGWVVECKAANQSVLVLNPKEIGKLYDSRAVPLEEALIRRICHQVDQRCRSQMS